jgi:hypothetical protein
MEPQMMLVQAAASVLSGALLAVAFFLLWSKSKSPWLLLALIATGVSLLFRLVYALGGSSLLGMTALFTLTWQATYLFVAAGLLGYALDETKKRG